jgi:hypothetical protein
MHCGKHIDNKHESQSNLVNKVDETHGREPKVDYWLHWNQQNSPVKTYPHSSHSMIVYKNFPISTYPHPCRLVNIPVGKYADCEWIGPDSKCIGTDCRWIGTDWERIGADCELISNCERIELHFALLSHSGIDRATCCDTAQHKFVAIAAFQKKGMPSNQGLTQQLQWCNHCVLRPQQVYRNCIECMSTSSVCNFGDIDNYNNIIFPANWISYDMEMSTRMSLECVKSYTSDDALR